MKLKYLNHKNFLLTGAGSGIGMEVAKILLDNGAFLTAMVRNKKPLEPLLKSYPGKLFLVSGDVSKENDCLNFIKQALKKFSGIDGLIHCAGIGMRSPAKDLKSDVFRNILSTNFDSLFYLHKAAREYLEKSRGHLVVASSVQGNIPLPYRSSYTAAKHAVNAYMRCVRMEEKSISFLNVNFGYVNTGFSHNALKGNGEKYSTDSKRQKKGMEASVAAMQLIKAMIRRKKEVTPAGIPEKTALFVFRFFPRCYERLIERYAKPD